MVSHLPCDVVTVPGRADVLVGIAPAGFTEVSDGERVPVVTVGTSLAVSSLVTLRAGGAPVLLRGQGVFIVVNGGNITSRAEVVGWNIQWTFAGFAIIWPAQPGVTIEPCGALLAFLAHRIVFALPALEGDGIAGGGVTVAVTLPTFSPVEGAVHPGVSVVTALTG